MDLTQLKDCLEVTTDLTPNTFESPCITLETEISQELYLGMKEFISTNPHWNQASLISSALATFLFQNGCEDRAVTERYLNDLFGRADV